VTAPGPARPRSRRRDRHGRGLRSPLLSRDVDLAGRRLRVPAAQTRGERFDDLVLDAVEQLEERWAEELRGVEFAVEDVPPVGADPSAFAYDDDVVTDDTAGGAVPLGRLLPVGDGTSSPRVVVYRRPLEARAADRLELAELVHDVVVDQVARLLGLDPDEVDGQRDP
jgi:predicted Zn-dependent protease with MMP-like domain